MPAPDRVRAASEPASGTGAPPHTPPTLMGSPQASPRVEPADPAAAGPVALAQPVAATKPAEAPAAATTLNLMELLAPDQRQAMEQLSANLAKAAVLMQASLTRAGVTTAAAPPAELGEADAPGPAAADPFHVAPALNAVMGRLAAQPDRLMRAQAELFERYADLWRATTARMSGARMSGGEAQSVVAPAKGDKRFADPDWTANPVFDVMKQSYLLTANWLNELVAGVDQVDPLEKRRVEFFTKMLTDAFSPSNYLISNPAALKEAISSQGASLVRGAEHFAADLARGSGRLAISQTDYQRFKVGENVATAPGKVVFQNALFQLLQFSPSTEQVYETPLLILPPWINKYYILDLRPDNSMIRWLTGQGFTVFLTSWVNPDVELAGKTLDDYMFEGVYAAVEQVIRQTGAPQVNTVGYCIGGTMLACALAHMAARGLEAVKSATFFAAQQDFAEAGDLLLFTSEDWVGDVEKQMKAAGGVLPGSAMADTFNMLRGNDLIWSFFVNNYLMGKEPAAFDLLFWNSDQTRMPQTLHLSYLRNFYQGDRLAKGELELGGERLDMKAVKVPVYVQSSREDHIAPMRSVYRGAKLFGGPTQFTLSGSGHIAGVINPPAANKYQHWTNPDLPATVEAWMADAVEHKGSWWPHWAAWLAERSGDKIAARDPASGPLGVIEDAPGSYVKVRSDTV